MNVRYDSIEQFSPNRLRWFRILRRQSLPALPPNLYTKHSDRRFASSALCILRIIVAYTLPFTMSMFGGFVLCAKPLLQSSHLAGASAMIYMYFRVFFSGSLHRY